MLSILKAIGPGTWRHLGLRVQGTTLLDIPIAGATLDKIHTHAGGSLFSVGRVKVQNAFVIERPPFRLLYVRPDYKGYRRVAGKVFANCQWAVDYDHTLGKKMASALGCAYVLMIRAIPSVNRGHGRFEHVSNMVPGSPDLCFVSSRIANKFIGRAATHMTGADNGPYDPGKRASLGWTLQQQGKWAHAIGFEDAWHPNPNLVLIK